MSAGLHGWAVAGGLKRLEGNASACVAGRCADAGEATRPGEPAWMLEHVVKVNS